MSPVLNSIADLREAARRRVPRAIFDYADRGSYDEVTFNRNLSDLAAIQPRQRVMVDVSKQQLSTEILGEPWSMPCGIGPTGLTGLFHANGEMLGARAAQAFGVPFCLSTMSICSIEDVRGAVQKPFWFQVYLMRDRGFNLELLERAKAANCSAIMLTVDMPVQGLRRRDPKNGLSIPPRLTLKNIFEVAMRPTWALKVLTGKRRTFGNLEARMKGTGGLKTLSEWIAQQFDATVTWKDLAWLRENWSRKILIKGILDAEDARLAVQHGVDAMWCRITAAGSSTARARRFPRCPRWSMPSQDAAKCCSTAACVPARTCSRRWPWAPGDASSARPSCTRWQRAAKPAWRWRSTSSARSWP